MVVEASASYPIAVALPVLVFPYTVPNAVGVAAVAPLEAAIVIAPEPFVMVMFDPVIPTHIQIRHSHRE